LFVTIADKLVNVWAILADYHRLGYKLWVRFNAGKEDQLWYYRTYVQAFDATGYSGPILDELRRLV
jgi:hypothetical protein